MGWTWSILCSSNKIIGFKVRFNNVNRVPPYLNIKWAKFSFFTSGKRKKLKGWLVAGSINNRSWTAPIAGGG